MIPQQATQATCTQQRLNLHPSIWLHPPAAVHAAETASSDELDSSQPSPGKYSRLATARAPG